MSKPVITVEDLGKAYYLGQAMDRHATMREKIASIGKDVADARAAEVHGRRPVRRRLLGGAARELRGEPRRGARAGRPQRRGQEHAAEGPQPHHRADRGPGHHPRPGRVAAGGRDRLPPGADRPREHLPQRRDPGDEQAGDQGQVRRDRRLQRGREVPRHAGEAVLVRHVRPAGVRGRGAPGAGGADRGRGARGRRPGVPEEVPGEDGRRRPRGPHGPVRQPQHGRRDQPLHARRAVQERPGVRAADAGRGRPPVPRAEQRGLRHPAGREAPHAAAAAQAGLHQPADPDRLRATTASSRPAGG